MSAALTQSRVRVTSMTESLRDFHPNAIHRLLAIAQDPTRQSNLHQPNGTGPHAREAHLGTTALLPHRVIPPEALCRPHQEPWLLEWYRSDALRALVGRELHCDVVPSAYEHDFPYLTVLPAGLSAGESATTSARADCRIGNADVIGIGYLGLQDRMTSKQGGIDFSCRGDVPGYDDLYTDYGTVYPCRGDLILMDGQTTHTFDSAPGTPAHAYLHLKFWRI